MFLLDMILWLAVYWAASFTLVVLRMITLKIWFADYQEFIIILVLSPLIPVLAIISVLQKFQR